MTKRSRGSLSYTALLLALNLVAGGVVAVAKSVDASDPYSIISLQTALHKLNNGDKVSAVTRPGECGVGEVICAHDAPEKASAFQSASTRDVGDGTPSKSAQ